MTRADTLMELGIYKEEVDIVASNSTDDNCSIQEALRGGVDLISFSRLALKRAKLRGAAADAEIVGLIILAQNGDRAAAQEVVERNIGFIIKQAASWSKGTTELMMEFIHDGVVKTYECIEKFNCDNGECTFLTYLNGCLKNMYGYKIREYTLKHGKKDATYGVNRIAELKRGDNFRAILGDRQVAKLTAEEIMQLIPGCTLETAYKIQRVITSATISINAPDRRSDDGDRPIIESIADARHVSQEALVIEKDRRDRVLEIIRKLPPRQKLIAMLKFNIKGDGPIKPLELCSLSNNKDLMETIKRSVSEFIVILKALCVEFKPRANGKTTMKLGRIIDLELAILNSEDAVGLVINGENELGKILTSEMDDCTETLCAMAVGKMTEVDRLILTRIFTIPTEEDYERNAIWKVLGITRERAGQIWHKQIEPFIKSAIIKHGGYDDTLEQGTVERDEYLY